MFLIELKVTGSTLQEGAVPTLMYIGCLIAVGNLIARLNASIYTRSIFDLRSFSSSTRVLCSSTQNGALHETGTC